MPDGVKFSQFTQAVPDSSDKLVGLHGNDNAKFSFADIIAAVRNGLASIFVPLTRTINNKALSSNITLDASDVGAVDTADVGAANGVAELDSTGKVPSSQLPPIASTAADVTYDNTQSGLTADDVQEAIDELAQGGSGTTVIANPAGSATDTLTKLQVENTIYSVSGSGSGASEAQLAYVESGTTASRNYTAGQYISLNGLLYTADTAIASGATFYTSGGNKNLSECVGGGFNNLPLRCKEFQFTTATLGTSFSPASRLIGTATALFGIPASKIVTVYFCDATLTPGAILSAGTWEDYFYVAATQSATLSNNKTILCRVIYTP